VILLLDASHTGVYAYYITHLYIREQGSVPASSELAPRNHPIVGYLGFRKGDSAPVNLSLAPLATPPLSSRPGVYNYIVGVHVPRLAVPPTTSRRP
jgi:hypothetical protein